MALGSIVIDLLLRSGAFESDAKKAEKRLRELEKSAKVAGAAIGGVLAGGFALFMKNTMDAEREQAQLAAALKSTGEAAGYSQSQLNAMADQLAKSSAISAGEITEAQTRLLSYSAIAGEQFPRALQLAIDQSVRLGESLTQSAETVGKALEYPAEGVSALTKQGFRFTEEQKKMLKVLEETGRLAEAQAIVMGVMEESYAGAAEAARNTLGGSLTVLKNTLNDLVEGDAGSLDGATDAINRLTEAVSSPEFQQGVSDVIDGAANLASSLARAIPDITSFGREFTAMVRQMGIDAAFLIEAASAAGDGIKQIATLGIAGGTWGQAEGRWQNAFRTRQQMVSDNQAALRLRRAEAQHRTFMANLAYTGTYNGPGLEGMDALRPKGQPRPTDVDLTDPKGSRQRKAAITEEQKAAAELSRTFQSYVDRLHQANVLFGEQSELARVNYEIQYGSLKGLADAEAQLLRSAASRNDAQKAAAEQREREFDAFMDDQRVIEGVWDDIEKEVAERTGAMTVFAEQAARNMQDAFADFLFDPFKDGLDGMLKGFADILRRMAAEAAAAKIFESLGQYGQANGGTWWGQLLSAFGGTKKASGGYIAGPGTATSDSIPALLSNGEYVIKAAAVSQYGRGFFESLNARRFASGGYVGGGAPAMAMGGGNLRVEIVNNGSPAKVDSASMQKQPDGSSLLRMVISGVADDLANGGRTMSAIKGRLDVKERV